MQKSQASLDAEIDAQRVVIIQQIKVSLSALTRLLANTHPGPMETALAIEDYGHRCADTMIDLVFEDAEWYSEADRFQLNEEIREQWAERLVEWKRDLASAPYHLALVDRWVLQPIGR
jgi:hypothetical protein